MMKGNMGKQRGMTILSWVVVLTFMIFLVFIALKIAPIYSNYFTIKSALQSLKEDGLMTHSVSEIHDKLSKRLYVNSIDFITKDNIAIAQSGGTTLVEVYWEEQRNVVGNLDVIAFFEEQIEFETN
jgi:hypothetical protein